MKKLISIIMVLTFIAAFTIIPAMAADCPRCNGKGQYTCDDCKGTTKCRFCNGSGTNDDGQPCQACINNPGVCARCGGSGMETCPDCKGTGVDPNSPPETTTAAPAATTAAPATTTAASATETAAPENDTPAAAPGQYGKTDASFAAVVLPSDRHTIMYLGTPGIENDDFAGTTATGVIRYEEMTPEQQAVYDSISDEELAQILGNVQGIISTVDYDTADESKPAVEAFLAANKLEILDDANIIPITFDGHIDIGFPVQVSVEVDPGRFSGSKPLHVFHIAADGTITQIPDENVNWITKEDGSVSRVEYYTDTFSDFLVTDTEGLVIPETGDIAVPNDDVTTIGATEKSGSPLKIVAIVIIALLVIAAIVFFVLKNKKAPAVVEDAAEEIKDKVEEKTE